MKKIDNKGFVIVETIIVAVFIIGICTFLFANFIPLIGEYERVEKYDTLEKKYKTNEIRKMILMELTSSNEEIFTSVDADAYKIYSTVKEKVNDKEITTNEICSHLKSVNYCNMLLSEDFMNVKSIVVTPFKLANFKTITKSNNNFTKAERQYIQYLPSYNKYSSRYDSYYRILVFYNDGEFSNIEVRYEIG